MRLLERAWCEHDVAVFSAYRYDIVSKILYFLFLLLGIAQVVFTVFVEVDEEQAISEMDAASDLVNERQQTITVQGFSGPFDHVSS